MTNLTKGKVQDVNSMDECYSYACAGVLLYLLPRWLLGDHLEAEGQRWDFSFISRFVLVTEEEKGGDVRADLCADK